MEKFTLPTAFPNFYGAWTDALIIATLLRTTGVGPDSSLAYIIWRLTVRQQYLVINQSIQSEDSDNKSLPFQQKSDKISQGRAVR
jgi:hypothetical protein